MYVCVLICFQTEQLVDQQILINRLRSNLVTFRGASSGASVEAGASGNSDKRPHSVTLIRHSCGYGPTRRVGSCNVLRVCVWLLLVTLVILTTNWCCCVHSYVHAHTCSWLCIFLSECMCVCRFTPVPQPIHWRGWWQPLRCAVISCWLRLRKRMRYTVRL